MPKILIMYGAHKIGKTELILKLGTRCISIDGEGGHEAHTSRYLDFHSWREFDECVTAIDNEGAKLNPPGSPGTIDSSKLVYPSDFICLDTVDALEEVCERAALVSYKNTAFGKDFDGLSVLELSHGLGYHYLREEVMKRIHKLNARCKYLIIISHTNVKEASKKEGITASYHEISLTGKIRKMICDIADAIGYIYRDPKTKELLVSFKAPLDVTTMGCRQAYLANKIVPAKWEVLYPGAFGLPIPGAEGPKEALPASAEVPLSTSNGQQPTPDPRGFAGLPNVVINEISGGMNKE